MNKIYVAIAGVVALVLAVLGAWSYVHDQDAKIDQLTETVTSQAIAVEQGRQALDVLRNDIKGLKALTDTFNAKVAGIQARSAQVTTTLNSKAFQSSVKADPVKASKDISEAINGLFSDVNAASEVSDAK